MVVGGGGGYKGLVLASFCAASLRCTGLYNKEAFGSFRK